MGLAAPPTGSRSAAAATVNNCEVRARNGRLARQSVDTRPAGRTITCFISISFLFPIQSAQPRSRDPLHTKRCAFSARNESCRAEKLVQPRTFRLQVRALL